VGTQLCNSAEQVWNPSYCGNTIVTDAVTEVRPIGWAFLNEEGLTIDSDEQSSVFEQIPREASRLCILVTDDIGNKGWVDISVLDVPIHAGPIFALEHQRKWVEYQMIFDSSPPQK
jgi:hypothetical protein